MRGKLFRLLKLLHCVGVSQRLLSEIDNPKCNQHSRPYDANHQNEKNRISELCV